MLVRCLMMVIGACLAGWSLNHALARSGPGGFSIERIAESFALFVGLGLVWIAALRHSHLDSEAPLWQRMILEGIPAAMGLTVFGLFMAALWS